MTPLGRLPPCCCCWARSCGRPSIRVDQHWRGSQHARCGHRSGPWLGNVPERRGPGHRDCLLPLSSRAAGGGGGPDVLVPGTPAAGMTALPTGTGSNGFWMAMGVNDAGRWSDRGPWPGATPFLDTAQRHPHPPRRRRNCQRGGGLVHQQQRPYRRRGRRHRPPRLDSVTGTLYDCGPDTSGLFGEAVRPGDRRLVQLPRLPVEHGSARRQCPA